MREEEKKIKYAYIDTKVTALTVAMEAHKRLKYDGKESKTASTFGGQVLRNSGRAAASWRSDF